MITAEYPGVTEVEAGSYIFMDATYTRVEGLEKYCPALTVLSTVISLPRPGVAICDAGRKTITFEPNRPMPTVKGLEGLAYEASSEEHGRMSVEEGSVLRVGDKIEFIVSHCCTNVNLYDRYHCLRDDYLEAVWEITARGRSQ
jgi:D-serine deaminase-like pyridoxal phosphate-dependent protein